MNKNIEGRTSGVESTGREMQKAPAMSIKIPDIANLPTVRFHGQ